MSALNRVVLLFIGIVLFSFGVTGLVFIFGDLSANAFEIGSDGSVIYDMPYGQEIQRPGQEMPTYIFKTPYGSEIIEPAGVDRYPDRIYRPGTDVFDYDGWGE